MYMSNQNYLRAEDVAEIMGISKAYAYKIMRKLNAELEERDGEIWNLPCDGAFICLGGVPETGLFRGQVALDEQGYITVSGRINRKYFMERTCYGTNEQKDGD